MCRWWFDCVIIDCQDSDHLACERAWASRNIRRRRALKLPDSGRDARTAMLHQLAAAYLNDTSSTRNAYPAFCALRSRGARRSLALFVHCKALFAAGKTAKTPSDRGENNAKTKAKRKRFALRYLRPMTDTSWNKPKADRLAWQARRSPLLGRRTGAERLYSDDGHHRDGARLATFARTRIRGFEEVLRARDGRA